MRSNRVNTATSRRTSARGFSLIELLLVVAVILIIAAIALPNFIKSKMRANEATAVQNLRNITTAEVVYSTTYQIGFSPDLPSLGGAGVVIDQTQAALIDQVLAGGTKTGYVFTYAQLTVDAFGHVTSYAVNADPLVQNQTGVRHFYADQTGVLRVNNSAAAGASDPPL
jgi:type IV pilus assembly protein PilA